MVPSASFLVAALALLTACNGAQGFSLSLRHAGSEGHEAGVADGKPQKRVVDPQTQDAIDILSGGKISAYSGKTLEALKRGASLTFADWMKSGPDTAQSLKQAFNKSSWVRRRSSARCGDDAECAWRQQDAMMCQALETAFFQDRLGEIRKLEKVMLSNVASSELYGVDWASRSAMIARWKDPEWPPAGPAENAALADVRSRVVDRERFVDMVTRSCMGLDALRPGCRQFAPRALFCQVLAASAPIFGGSKAVVTLLDDVLMSGGDAKDVINTTFFDTLADNTQEIFRAGANLSFDDWLQSGASEAARTFKVKFSKSKAVKDNISQTCSYVYGECALKLEDPLLCSSLESAGEALATKEIEASILTLVRSDVGDAMGTATRSALIAKWANFWHGEQDRREVSKAFESMKRRTLEEETFKAAVNKTCLLIGRSRPECWDDAPNALFCQALLGASADALGTEKLMAEMKLGASADALGENELTTDTNISQ